MTFEEEALVADASFAFDADADPFACADTAPAAVDVGRGSRVSRHEATEARISALRGKKGLRSVASAADDVDAPSSGFAVTDDRLTAKSKAAQAQGSGGGGLFDTAYEGRLAQSIEQRATSFEELRLSRPLLRAVREAGYASPTPIQAAAIPVALAGRDVCGGAETGSGKTAAFLLPALERLSRRRPDAPPAIRVLVLLPTRELAVQCFEAAQRLSAHVRPLPVVALAAGGLPLRAQEVALRAQPDIVVATPGRLIDIARNGQGVALDSVEILVLDEADRMLEDGFSDELGEILRLCGARVRQTMLFSASMTEEVSRLARLALQKPVRVLVDSTQAIASRLQQDFVRVRVQRDASVRGPSTAKARQIARATGSPRGAPIDNGSCASCPSDSASDSRSDNEVGPESDAPSEAGSAHESETGSAHGSEAHSAADADWETLFDEETRERLAIVLALCRRTCTERCIVFVPTKELARRTRLLLGLAGLSAAELHGGLPQTDRLDALTRFRDGRAAFLVATDVAARGLDIPGVTAVINYAMPSTYNAYLHRVGRTARAGAAGLSVTLVGEGADRRLLKQVVANSATPVRHRVLPAAALAEHRALAADLLPGVAALAAEEDAEREIVSAERLVRRGENVLRHGTEIASRPKRTWFQPQASKRRDTRSNR